MTRQKLLREIDLLEKELLRVHKILTVFMGIGLFSTVCLILILTGVECN